MTEQTLGHRQGTGLTRAKHIERLSLWLGLPLLLLLLSLTAGVVNYTPVDRSRSGLTVDRVPAEAAPVERATPAPSIPVRSDRLVPLAPADDPAQSLELAPSPPLS